MYVGPSELETGFSLIHMLLNLKACKSLLKLKTPSKVYVRSTF